MIIKKIKYLIYLVLALCFTSCGWQHLFEDWSVTLEHPIFTAYEKEMKKKRGYWTTLLGSSAPNDDVRYLIMSFAGVYQTDIPQARRLYVELVEGLVSKINQNVRIRPYLHDYPATWRNTQVGLRFEDRKGERVKEPYIAYVFIAKEKIIYSIYHHKTGQFEEVYEELYVEALKIIQEES